MTSADQQNLRNRSVCREAKEWRAATKRGWQGRNWGAVQLEGFEGPSVISSSRILFLGLQVKPLRGNGYPCPSSLRHHRPVAVSY